MLEVKSGEGGEESALFAADLARMYIRYAERHGWTVTMLDETTSDLGGYKDATLSIRSKGDSADGVWSRLKFEGGVHRVQRVPVTESQGRVHTSAAGVLVYPEPEEVEEVQIDESDLRIDVYRSSGKGGQGVNTTDSAVRITHLPTGIVVTCQNERSQLQNKARAMQVLAARLQALAEEQAQADASADRASQIRTVDRSERIRTYNFPENRIADHRINFKAHNLDQVLDGDLDALFDALAAADKQSRLQQSMSPTARLRREIERRSRRARRGRSRIAARPTPSCSPPMPQARVGAGCRCSATSTTTSSAATPIWSPRAHDEFRCSTSSVPPPFGPVTVAVGPGVFIPRPETEGLLEWASAQPLAAAAGDRRPVHRLGRAGAGPVEVLARRPHHRRRRLRRSAGLRPPKRRGHSGRTGAGRRHRHRAAARTGRTGRPRWSPTRPTFPTV